MAEGFTRESSERAYQGYIFGVDVVTFTSPDGEAFTRSVVRHPGAVAVLPLSRPGFALVLRQWRPSVEEALLEAPAGTLDIAGEEPATAARRELAEEVGMLAGRLTELGSILNTPGICDQVTHLFLAEQLTPTERQLSGFEEVHSEVVEVALAELADGEGLVDGTTRTLALIALRRELR